MNIVYRQSLFIGDSEDCLGTFVSPSLSFNVEDIFWLNVEDLYLSDIDKLIESSFDGRMVASYKEDWEVKIKNYHNKKVKVSGLHRSFNIKNGIYSVDIILEIL